MQFKIDENLPQEAALVLGDAGHDAITVLGQNLGGAGDANIARVCQSENRILVTADVGFADIRAYPPNEYPGLIVLRLHRLDKVSVVEVVKRLLPSFQTEQIEKRLWLVEETRVRIRGEA
ncbi:MAG: DUF5615 family PIN-like protein [Actinobacteria bacterium]|nr:DUF5615 family PIN-like protein [Actinomycetota bacterium]